MLSPKSRIVIISSFASDKIRYQDVGVVKIKKGGPAFWISKTLKKKKLEFRMLSGKKPAEVAINIDKTGERGVFLSISKIHLKSKKKAAAFIISTVANEFSLNEINKLSGLVALDIQGYVRALKSKKDSKIKIPERITKKIDILKATREEARFLEKKFISDQKRRILILTEGHRGVDIFYHGRRLFLKVDKVSSIDTIGAGDVFLTIFVIEFLKGKNIKESGMAAINFTKKFLEEKK